MNMQKMEEKSLDSLSSNISVVDVYDLASDIGKECEKIIDCYGAEAVTALMPKVVNALEMLETLANQNENENTTMQMLSDRVASLESEKIERAVYREKLQRELETIEEQWHGETKELMELVNRLQEENRRIKHNEYKNVGDNVADGKQVPKPEPNASNLLNESDFQKLKRLRGQMEKQRDELMCRDQEIEEKNTEIENFSIQLERLRSSGRESRKRQKLLQTQVQKLLDERSDLLVQIQDQKREINVLRRSLGFGGNEKIDLKTASSAGCSLLSENDLKPLLMERDNLKAKVKELEIELKQFKPDVMHEIKVESIIEEKTPDELPEIPKIPDADEEDPPVQGPLPYEPDDAPWKRASEGTGVRKFFRKLFAEQSKSSIQRGTMSTLSKMGLSSSPSRSVTN